MRAKKQIEEFLAASVPRTSEERLSQSRDDLASSVAASPFGKSGMQRRVTALLGRSSSRNRNLARDASASPSASASARRRLLHDSNDDSAVPMEEMVRGTSDKNLLEASSDDLV